MTFEEFLAEWNDGKDYITAHTSGSTGKPKEIRLSKEFVRQSARRTIKYFDITRKSLLYSCVGADYIGGKMMAARASEATAHFSWEDPSNRPLQSVDKNQQIDLLAVVPSQMNHILLHLEDLPHIKAILVGGSPIHPEMKKKITESGLNAYETYGMTETASHIAIRKIKATDTPFHTMEGIKVALDEEGCLKIIYDDGVSIQTNDIGELLNEKEFFVRGRRDNVIISGGKKINPYELEERLRDLIDADFYFIGTDDEKWGKKLELVIEGEESEVNRQTYRNSLRDKLEKWEMPKEIKFLKKFSRTPNGKIIRKEI